VCSILGEPTFQLIPFSSKGLTSDGERPKFLTAYGLEIRPPLPGVIRFDMAGAGDLHRTELPEIDQFVVQAGYNPTRAYHQHHSWLSALPATWLGRNTRLRGRSTIMPSRLDPTAENCVASSRRVLHMAITRAHAHVLILDEAASACPIIDQHNL